MESISYDLTNALGVLTNQQVLVLDQFYSTNTWEYTTNTFQAFDIPLTNGLNVITLHATDLAGNVTTTNFSYTLDYSSATNPPVVQLYWPTDGTLICNGSYTWRGWVDDPTASVTAQLVDTNGATNIFSGVVERDGEFWVENLPLSNGTNFLTLTVADTAGNEVATNILVFPGAVGLTIDLPDACQLWNQGITVNGTISDEDDYTVWVNGVKAALNGDGTWTATNVFLPAGGTALIQARAIPNSDNGGNGTGGSGGGSVTYNNLGNPDPPADNDAEIQADKPWEVYVLEDHQKLNWSSDVQDDSYCGLLQTLEEDRTVYNYDQCWQSGVKSGGPLSGSYYHFDSTSQIGAVSLACSGSFSWPASDQPDLMGTITESGDAIPALGMSPGTCLYWPPEISWQHCDVNDPYTIATGYALNGWVFIETDTETYRRHADTKIHLRAGGKAGAGRQSLFPVTAWATEILDNRYVPDGMPTDGGISPQDITINGLALGADGIRWLAETWT
jgi:hypothetical protein